MEPDVNPAPVSEEQEVTEEVTEVKPQPGEKTDSALLLKSLHEEREKRRQAEAALEAERIRASQPKVDVVSEEGKLLDSKIAALEAEIQATRAERELSKVQTTYPMLKDKSEEFEQYRAENPGMRLDVAAKAFLAENDLLEPIKPRKGLESGSGGGARAPVSTGMTPEEIDALRVNNYNEYARRIRAGTLK